jgi:hypothetical protein
MTRLKFDVAGVDPGGDFAVPKPGAYACKVDVIEPKESAAGNEMLEVQYVITEDGEFEGSRLWDYIVLTENQRWKYRRFLEAIGAVTDKKESGEIDIDKVLGKRVLVKVTNEDSEEWGKRARVGSVSKLGKAGDVEDEGDEDEGDEDELTYDEVMGMSKTELKELIDENELDVRVTKATKVANLRPKVAEALELEEEPEDEEEPEEDEEELTAEDVQGYNKTELKEVIEENDLGIRVTAKTKLPVLRKKVVAKLIEEEMIEDPDAEEEGEEDEVEEVEDYGELSVSDLRAEAKERGLETKGTKSALVKRLEKDDEEADAL